MKYMQAVAHVEVFHQQYADSISCNSNSFACQRTLCHQDALLGGIELLGGTVVVHPAGEHMTCKSMMIITGPLQRCVHGMSKNLCHQALQPAGEHITCKSVVITTGSSQQCVHGMSKNATKQLCHQVLHSAGEHITCKSVVITTGTFLRGVVHVGSKTKAAGRMPSSHTEVLEVTCSHFLLCVNCTVTVFQAAPLHGLSLLLVVMLCHACIAMLCVFALPWIILYCCICRIALGCTDVFLLY